MCNEEVGQAHLQLEPLLAVWGAEGRRGIPQVVSSPLPSESLLGDVVGTCRTAWLDASVDGLQPV